MVKVGNAASKSDASRHEVSLTGNRPANGDSGVAFIGRVASKVLIAGLLFVGSSLSWFGHIAEAQFASRDAAKLPVLTTASAVHSLTVAQAAQRYPVHLRGVITSFDPTTPPGHAAVFLNDGTGSIYVMVADGLNQKISAGTLIDVEGVSGAGSAAPLVEFSRVEVIGHSHLPENPPREDLSRLTTGAEDGKWVEVEGTIHAVYEHEHYVTLQLAMAGGTVGVSMAREPGARYFDLIDAKVVIRANAAPSFNRNDQIIGARLMAPGLSTVRILNPAPREPFAQPITLIDNLLRWSQISESLHRVHLRGYVTLQWPGSSLCIRDETRAICAQTTQTTPVNTGEVVDVVGFAEADNGTTVLTDAVFQPGSGRKQVIVKPTTAEQALLGKDDSELIQVEGVLIGSDESSSNVNLIMSSGDLYFNAELPKSLAGNDANMWKVGSRLRLTGICSVHLDVQSGSVDRGVAAAKYFSVLMRSPEDVTVLRYPSWWTPSHTLAILAVALLVTILVLSWVIALRKQVAQQTTLLRESEERFRYMAEHDSLTGLPSRLVLRDRLSLALQAARRDQKGLSLLMLDIDKFKSINDTLGHHAGDTILQVVAARILQVVRQSDTAARMGGDEFVILLPDVSDQKTAEDVAAKIVSALSIPVPFEECDLPISVSVGVLTTARADGDVDLLLKNVDVALYRAKARGRNRFEVFDPEMALPASV